MVNREKKDYQGLQMLGCSFGFSVLGTCEDSFPRTCGRTGVREGAQALLAVPLDTQHVVSDLSHLIWSITHSTTP